MERLYPIIDNIFAKIFKQTNFIPYEYSLFQKVITHKTKSKDNYEVLECLGDGYLKGFIISAILEVYPDANEKFISEARMTLERTETFAYLLDSEFPGLSDLIDVDDDIRNSTRFDNIKEDVFEALVGALITYIGLRRENLLCILKNFYVNMFVIQIKHMEANNEDINTNYVTMLNDYCGYNKIEYPKYTVVNKENIGCGVMFKMQIQVGNTILYEEDKSEKAAKQKCAKCMLNYLKGKKKYEIVNDLSNISWFI